MGMSGDYETAVMLGATHVRVGTALFGAPRVSGTRARLDAFWGGLARTPRRR